MKLIIVLFLMSLTSQEYVKYKNVPHGNCF